MFRILIKDDGYLHAISVEDAYYDTQVEVETADEREYITEGLCFNYAGENHPAYLVEMSESDAKLIMRNLVSMGYADLSGYDEAVYPIEYEEDDDNSNTTSDGSNPLLEAAYAAAPNHIV